MKVSTLVLLCASSLVSVNAFAQWQWLDAQGRKVFSDLPPSNQVPAERILQRPSNVRPTVTAPPSGAAPSGAAPSGAAPSANGRGVDRELQSRKTAEEAEQARREQAQTQEQEKKLAAQRQDNCVRARVTLATLADGKLVGHTNAQGERVYMDDNARALERQRAQGIIASDCGAAAGSAAPRAAPAPGVAQPGVSQPGGVPPLAAMPPAASRRDPTPPGSSGAGLPRPGRPDEPGVPTIQ